MTDVRRRPADIDADELALFEHVERDLAAGAALRGACPEPGRMMAARSGEVPPVEAQPILDHVRACAVCRMLAEALDEVHAGDLHEQEIARLDRRVATVITAQAPPARVLAFRRQRGIALTSLAAAASLGIALLAPSFGPVDVPAVPGVPRPAVVGVLPLPVLRAERLDTSVMGLAGVTWRGDAEGHRPTSSFDEARRAFDEGDLGSATTTLDAITRETPTFGDAWLLLGMARLGAGDAVAAVPALERARALLSADARHDAEWHLAVALHAAGRDADARAVLQPLCWGTAARAGLACLALDELQMP